MSTNATQTTVMITIASAGSRLGELSSRIWHLYDVVSGLSSSRADKTEATRGLTILEAEQGALKDYVTLVPATSPEDALVQIEALSLQLEAFVDEDMPEEHKKFVRQMARTFASVSGVIADAGQLSLEKFGGLSEAYSRAFPLATRSAFAASELGRSYEGMEGAACVAAPSI